MHHRRRSLLSAAGWMRAAIPAMVLGCDRPGSVVVLLESIRATPAVEVVAIRAAEALATDASLPRSTADSVARLRALDDSAATLAERFRARRDSINREVASLDSLDRRTRGYAVRYADVRRRTMAAEQLRDARDTARRRADALRARLAPVLATARDGDDAESAVTRKPLSGSAITLALAPGDWLIGLAAPGSQPSRMERVRVNAGGVDTVRLRP